MKNKLQIISLLILPVIFYVLAIIFKHAKGEYYLFDNYDGPYSYLLASLNVSQMFKPGYTQHPGIVPQVIMAVVMKISYLLQAKDLNIVADTFNRPEFYLHRVNMIFILLNVTALFILGFFSYKKIGNIFAAFFLQLTVFNSTLFIYQMTQIIPEPVLIFLIIILLTITVSFLNENVMTKNKNFLYILLFGITCGLALATKISVLPILIVPFLIIKKFRYKSYFVLTSIVTFSLLFLSVTPDSSLIWKFIFSSTIHSGKYGSGSANFVDTAQIIPKLELIYMNFNMFCIIYLVIIVALILQFIPAFKNQIRTNKYFLLLTGVFVIMTFFILLVIKQSEGYYIMPGIMFSIVGLFAVNSIVSELFPKYFKFSKYLYLFLFFIVFTIPQFRNFKNYLNFFDNRKNESYKIVKHLKDNYPNSIIVGSDQTASMQTAFQNGLNFSGDQKLRHFYILKDKYPDYVYFSRPAKQFIYIDWNKDLKNRLINSDKFIFHCFDEVTFNDFKKAITELTEKPNITYEEVYSNKNGEKLYEVYLK